MRNEDKDTENAKVKQRKQEINMGRNVISLYFHYISNYLSATPEFENTSWFSTDSICKGRHSLAVLNFGNQHVFSPIKTSFLSKMFFWGSCAAELPVSIVLPVKSGSAPTSKAPLPCPSSFPRRPSSSWISESPLGPATATSLFMSASGAFVWWKKT